ncbi:MAG: hypothetical protein ACPKPY_09055 [Nitrososphaeraceae archaeon]
MRKTCCNCNAQFFDTYGDLCLDCAYNKNIKSKDDNTSTIFYINEWTFERQNSTGYAYGFNNKTKSTIHGYLIFYQDGGITLQNKKQQLILKYPNKRFEKTNW